MIRATAIALVAALFVSGCFGGGGTPVDVNVTDTRTIGITVPPSLEEECVIPKPPAGNSASEISLYITQLLEELATCKGKHDGVLEVIDDYQMRLQMLENGDLNSKARKFLPALDSI